MQRETLSDGFLQVVIQRNPRRGREEFHLADVRLRTASGWRTILRGVDGAEFSTSLGDANATRCERIKNELSKGGWRLRCRQRAWEAEETVQLASDPALVLRRQTYHVLEPRRMALHPGFRLIADPETRYTFPLRAHEQPLEGLGPLRSAVDWALPFPFHVWHTREWVAIYGLNKAASPGTLDFLPVGSDGCAGLRVYYPETGEPQPTSLGAPGVPGLLTFEADDSVTLAEIVAAKTLKKDDEPLLEAERLAADILLGQPPAFGAADKMADGIADFYRRCGLWEPNALGQGRGWFGNMWVRTQSGPARKRGEMSGYYDLGWGEGIAVEMMTGMLRYWHRTGRDDLLSYVDEMSRHMELFKRSPGAEQPYYDRSDGKRFGDFLLDNLPGGRIWSHSLGHIGTQLIQLCEEAPDYPRKETRDAWFAVAASCARFFARQQGAEGDIQDIFDDRDCEANVKPHRITARAVVCGLWTRFGLMTGETSYVGRALRLARAVAPEILRYEYFNQMIDGFAAPEREFTDGEAAYYVLEGLVPLYAATRDSEVLACCRKAAAFGICWTYFYNLPKAHEGIARGGQCCRMDDFPLLYPIGPAKSVKPLLELYEATGDRLFEKMAEEAAAFLSRWQMDAPGQPWHGGMVHAVAQYCGKHWGPDLAGQVDTGMATGNSLAAIEAWLAHLSRGGSADKVRVAG